MSANDRQVGGEFYKLPIQIWDFVHRNGIGFLAGNAIKYLCRYKSKGGIADLEKAKHYVEKLIEEEKAEAERAAAADGAMNLFEAMTEPDPRLPK